MSIGLLIITGSMGAGKSSALAEASDILTLRRIVHAAIDLDALGFALLPAGDSNDGVMYRNLETVCTNYASLGVERFLLARAIETQAELDLCRSAVAATNIVVCRLTASIGVMEKRVRARESGILQREFVARVATLEAVLDRAHLENFTVANENRSLNEVAQEMLTKAGWIRD